MTLTITLPAELEAKIAERAAAKGVTLEEYAFCHPRDSILPLMDT